MRRLSGGARSALIIGGQGIRSRKLRTLLSMVSLFLGVLAVVVVQAGAETAKRAAVADVELRMGRDGTRLVNIPGDPRAVATALDTLRHRTDAVVLTRMQATIGEPGVQPVNPGGAPFDQAGGGGYYGPTNGDAVSMMCDGNGCRPMFAEGAGGANAPPGQAVALNLYAMTGDVLPFRPYRMKSGTWLDFRSAPSYSPGLVVNLEAAKGFSRYRIPAQMQINRAIAEPTPRIIGVVDDGLNEPMAYLRWDELTNWLPETAITDPNGGTGIEILMSPTAAGAEQVLRTRLLAQGFPADQFHVETVEARKQAADQLALIRWIFLGMAGLVLLIGVAGILNVGLATVGERVEEFALRRAVGTPRLLLAGIVLCETLLTGLFTAAAAIGVGALGVKAVSRLLGSQHAFLSHLEFPWQAGAAGIIAGLVAGVLGGLIPAIRAARIPIASVMRA